MMIFLFYSVGYFPFSKELCKQQAFILHGGRVLSFSICMWRDWHAEKNSLAFSEVSCIRRQTFPEIFRDADHVRHLWTSAKVVGIYETGKHWYCTKLEATLENIGLGDSLGLKRLKEILDIAVISTSLLFYQRLFFILFYSLDGDCVCLGPHLPGLC